MKKLLFLLLFFASITPLLADSAQIKGDKMEVDKETNKMKLQGHVFAIRKTTGSTLQADQLELTRDEITEKLTLGKAEGGVVLHDELDVVLCEYLNFDDSEKIAQLQGNIFFTTGELFLTGHKLRYNYEAEKGHLFGEARKQTTSTFHREKPDVNGQRLPIKAWAKEIIINRALGKITLQGSVKVIDETDGSTMTAQRMDVYLTKKEQVKEIIADGDFTLNQPGRKANSDRAFLDYQTEIITLTGKAFVKEEGSAAVNSGRIEMFMDSNKGNLKGEDKEQVSVDVEL